VGRFRPGSLPRSGSTHRAEIRTSPDSSGERATINAGVAKVSSAQFENVSWKTGGCGIESSALDLALFGDGVLRNRYFPQTTRNAALTQQLLDIAQANP
jgi:hypothetical protein